MIEDISIRSLGVIDSVDITFSRRLTVMTGETGAGKTMVLSGLGLLMGTQSDSALVRPGASAALVQGTIQVAQHPAAVARILESGSAIDEDGTTTIVRTVAKEGRSRVHLGGRSVPRSVLGEIATELITVHGQSDQARLRTPVHQRNALDTFAGSDHKALLEDYRTTWTQWKVVGERIQSLVTDTRDRQREVEQLRLGLAAIERVNPQPGEDIELTAQIARLSHAEELRMAVQLAHELIDSETDLSAGINVLIGQVIRALEGAVHHDPSLQPTMDRVTEIRYLTSDIASDLARYRDVLQADPRQLEQAHTRLAALGSLTRGYGQTIDEVLDWASAAGLRLLELDDDDNTLKTLRQQEEELGAQVDLLAQRLTDSRVTAAECLSAEVSRELRGLAMPDARLTIRVEPTDWGPSGADQVIFDLIPHQGAPARPLAKGASGGELSRVMLALELCLATGQTDGAALPTFVFDEVDAGIGGKAATEVGRRLAQLAEHTQVIVVTHLAQVAAFADCHLVVTKTRSLDQGSTVTGVLRVDGDDRTSELARMLSGREDSVAALRHASELLATAAMGR